LFETAVARPRGRLSDFDFPSELRDKIARRDRIDSTKHLPEIMHEAAVLTAALRHVRPHSTNADLLAVMASDAVTKKVRYRFIGVGNGKYTIEIIKKPLLERVAEKIERCRQLAFVFPELRDVVGVRFGNVQVSDGDARDGSSWSVRQGIGTIITSPPYLPASSGREHYASARALAFSVLGLDPGQHGYYEAGSTADNGIQQFEASKEFEACPEAAKLLTYSSIGCIL